MNPFSKPLAKRPSPQKRWAMLTAYDALMACEAKEGGVDLLLVGDSLGTAILGYECVSQVTIEDMLHHTRAVCRGAGELPVVGDLPQNTYSTPQKALFSTRAMLEAGAHTVKLEGAETDIFSLLVKEFSIHPVAHLGYTPQKISAPRVVGKELNEANQLLEDAKALEQAGASALVLEMVPREVATKIAQCLCIPIIGIGSGPDIDGQVLVITDMWGESGMNFKFLRQFANIRQDKKVAVQAYCEAVHQGLYPADEHSFHLKKALLEDWKK